VPEPGIAQERFADKEHYMAEGTILHILNEVSSMSMGRATLVAVSALTLSAAAIAQTPGPAQKPATVAPRPAIQGAQGSGHLPSRVKPIILDTKYVNPYFDTTQQDWASKAVGGDTFGSILHDAPYEWTQVLDPTDEYEKQFVGLSGWAVWDGSNTSISGEDNPFTHPFGGVDTEFYVVPDVNPLPGPNYLSLAAPTINSLYSEAAVNAAKLNLAVINLIGVETDINLVPGFYRPQPGDRVCVWGRWIVDTGHDDFHSEIHPPALLVAARPNKANANDETDVTVLGRPFLVSQRFTPDSLPMKAHLVNEFRKIGTLFESTKVEAHPIIMDQAFIGNHQLVFTVRPPSSRGLATDKLVATYKFTVRTGISVQLASSGDTVVVTVTMNGDTYKRAALPTRHDLVISPSTIGKDGFGNAFDLGELISAIGINPAAYFLDQRGITTDSYDPLIPVLGNSTTVDVRTLVGTTPGVVLNNAQPFPISGFINLTWVHAARTAKP
jgi:hypothetical protein